MSVASVVKKLRELRQLSIAKAREWQSLGLADLCGGEFDFEAYQLEVMRTAGAAEIALAEQAIAEAGSSFDIMLTEPSEQDIEAEILAQEMRERWGFRS